MKEIIKFKPLFFNKLLKAVISIGLIISIIMFITIKINVSYIYLFCMVLIALLVSVVFYLNRNEPEQILIDNDTLTIFYFNKTLFKRGIVKARIFDLKLKNLNNSLFLILDKENNLIANVRISVLDEKDKLLFLGLFNKKP